MCISIRIGCLETGGYAYNCDDDDDDDEQFRYAQKVMII